MGKKICYLIIEDVEERQLLSTAIDETELDYEVIMDRSIERAKERFSRESEFHPAYVFVDYNIGLLNYIKSFSQFTEVPVVIYTAEINTAEIAEAKKARAAHCVLKTTHETALTSILLKLFLNSEDSFVMVSHPEESRGFLR